MLQESVEMNHSNVTLCNAQVLREGVYSALLSITQVSMWI